MFKILLHLNKDLICNITKKASYTNIMKKTILIMWHEVPMKYCNFIEVINKTF